MIFRVVVGGTQVRDFSHIKNAKEFAKRQANAVYVAAIPQSDAESRWLDCRPGQGKMLWGRHANHAKGSGSWGLKNSPSLKPPKWFIDKPSHEC